GDPRCGPAGGAAHRGVDLPLLRRLRVLLPGPVMAAAATARALHLGSRPHQAVRRAALSQLLGEDLRETGTRAQELLESAALHDPAPPPARGSGPFRAASRPGARRRS